MLRRVSDLLTRPDDDYQVNSIYYMFWSRCLYKYHCHAIQLSSSCSHFFKCIGKQKADNPSHLTFLQPRQLLLFSSKITRIKILGAFSVCLWLMLLFFPKLLHKSIYSCVWKTWHWQYILLVEKAIFQKHYHNPATQRLTIQVRNQWPLTT